MYLKDNKLKIVTHDGKFHPDEIFASVLLAYYHFNDRPTFIRTRNSTLLERYKKASGVYVIDVGAVYDPENNNFDHHQASFNLTGESGHQLSSCGLIWKHIKDDENFKKLYLLSDFMIKKITEFTESIDRHDNGVQYFNEVDFISMYNYSNSETRFKKAFNAANTYFMHKLSLWRSLEYISNVENIALNNAENGIIFSDEKLNVSEELNSTDNYLIVSPRIPNEEYVITSLNSGIDIDFSVRCPAPIEWSGLSDDAIKKFDSSLVFSHKNRFLTIVKGNKEDALRVANIIVDRHKQNALKRDDEIV